MRRPGRRFQDQADGLAKTERVDVERDVGPVQDAQDGRFAKDGGGRGDPHVDLAAGDDEGRAAVLGQALFPQVEVCDHLHPRDGRAGQVGRHGLEVDQLAIHPQAHPQLVAPGLEVDIGGAAGDGRLERGRDKPRAAALDSHVDDLIDLPLQPLGVRLGRRLRRLVEALVEHAPPVARAGGQHLDVAPGREHHPGQPLVVQRITRRTDQAPAGVGERQEPRPAQEVDREPKVLRRDLHGRALGAPDGAADHVGVGLRQMLVGQGAQLVQHLLDRLAGAGGDQLGAREGRVIHELQVLQAFQDGGALTRRQFLGAVAQGEGSHHCASLPNPTNQAAAAMKGPKAILPSFGRATP